MAPRSDALMLKSIVYNDLFLFFISRGYTYTDTKNQVTKLKNGGIKVSLEQVKQPYSKEAVIAALKVANIELDVFLTWMRSR